MKLLIPLLVGLVAAVALPKTRYANLVVFGDSWSDDGRLRYFREHDGAAPAAGAHLKSDLHTGMGGRAWTYFAAHTLGAQEFNYAVGGATCSNKVVAPFNPVLHQNVPSVSEYQVDAFIEDEAWEKEGKGKFFDTPRTDDNTVFAVWVGTNDLGMAGFLMGNEQPGTTLTNYTDCVLGTVDRLVREVGAKRVVLFNMGPIDRTPLYMAPENGGVKESFYWAVKSTFTPENATHYEAKLRDSVDRSNGVFGSEHVRAGARWAGAHVSLFDVHRLISDMADDPAKYVAAPAHRAEEFYLHCAPHDSSKCDRMPDPADTFLWQEQLHLSSKIEARLAEEFVRVVEGKSIYGIDHPQRD